MGKIQNNIKYRNIDILVAFIPRALEQEGAHFALVQTGYPDCGEISSIYYHVSKYLRIQHDLRSL